MFEIPADGLSALSDDDLAGLEAEGVEAFEGLDLSDDAPAEKVEEGEQIVAAIREIRAERSTREQAAAERAERVAAMKAEMEPKDEAEAEADEDEEPVAEADEDDEADAEAAVEEVVAEAEKIASDAVDAPEPVVAAAVEENPVAKAAAVAPAPTIKEKRMSVSLVASADSGFAAGERLDSLTAAAEGFMHRARGFGGPNTRQSAAFASIRLDSGVRVEDYGNDLGAAMDAAVKDRQHVDSLTAAAGWSSPSETIYDLCQYEQATNLLNLPEVSASRGGMRFTREPDFDTIYAGTGFDLTEAQVIADTSKGSYSVPDPAFVDVRLDAVGFVVRAGVLQNAAYPELVRRVIEGALVAHQYKVNAKMVAGITTALGAALTPADESALYSTLDSLAFVARAIRQKYRLADSHVLNANMALWVQDSIKADLARRTGRESAAVTDAEVNAWFTSRGLRAQFIYGLDELDLSGALPVAGKASTTVQMYPEGTFVKAQSPVIDLNAVYDSTLLDTNVYTAAFVEQGVQIVHRCLGGAAVTLPVTATGETGAADLVVGHGSPEL